MTRTLMGGGNRHSARAGGKTGLVGFRRLHMQSCPPVQSARGAAIKRPHPVRFLIGSVRHQPRSFFGALRGKVPHEGVAGDSAAAPAQGKTFPFRENPSLKMAITKLSG